VPDPDPVPDPLPEPVPDEEVPVVAPGLPLPVVVGVFDPEPVPEGAEAEVLPGEFAAVLLAGLQQTALGIIRLQERNVLTYGGTTPSQDKS
jgi:hypothetical protein